MEILRTTRRELIGALAMGSGLLLRPNRLAAGQARFPSPGGEMTEDRFAWFDEARLGLFLHWGAYSVAGVEASWPIMVPGLRRLVPQPAITEEEYRALPSRFDPVDFDPEGWVRLARRVGMGYIVLTAKHHDGFCMFDAPETEYKITNTPYGGDVCAELAAACARAGMPLGFYYSPPDMHHPGYRDTSRPAAENWTGQPERPEWSSYLDTMEAHLRKLLRDYGEVAVIWFDGLFDHDRYEPERFRRLIRELSPRTLVNDRLGPGDYVTPEQFFPSGIPIRPRRPVPAVSEEALVRFFELLLGERTRQELDQLFRTAQAMRYPTELLPSPKDFQRWETCLTMNRTWAYNPTDTEWKSPDELLRTVIEVASRGGNLLLNVGPSPRGTFPPPAVDRLERIGSFMDRYGEAIRGTTYGPVQGQEGLRSTERQGVVYLHLLPPVPERLVVEKFPRPASRVVRLSDREILEHRLTEGRLSVSGLLPSESHRIAVLAVEE